LNIGDAPHAFIFAFEIYKNAIMKTILITTIIALFVSNGFAQKFDLVNALKEGKLVAGATPEVSVSDESKRAISLKGGILWLKDETFSDGTIEVDIRGNDQLQGTFAGIIFHAVDTVVYDVLYFRPFNFQAADPVRKIHAVQYMSMPDYPWPLTREKMNGVYEKAVTPAPPANEWFHATIVVKGNQVTAYVNNSEVASITVTKLNDRKTGKFGLWCTGTRAGEFANLKVTR
jgi:Domain of Unknown Function (DUF1080)